jgi:RND superfamily putative drug exporter
MQKRLAGKLTGPVTKWVVAIFWIILVAGLGPFAGKLTGVLNNETSSWLPDSAESTQVLERLASFRDPNAMPTVVVHEAEQGKLTDDQLREIAAQLTQIKAMKGVTGEVLGPIVSEDGEAAEILAVFDLGKNTFMLMGDVADELMSISQQDGVKTYVTGQGGQAADSSKAFEGLDGTLLMWTALTVIVILLITYRSPVLWLLPIISAFVSLGIAQGVVYFLARDGGLTVNGQTQGMLTVLVFGAGTDYALLLVARYREELRRHEDRHEAMAFALHRAAPAIIASGSTVILGMLCLILASVNATSGLGPVAAIGIVIALAVMLTLLPALLVITGRWIFWPIIPTFDTPEPSTTGVWARLGNLIARAPRAVWALTTLILLVSSLGLLQLNATGLSTEDTYTKKFDSIIGQEVLEKHQLADQSNPVMIVARGEHLEAVAKALVGIPDLGEPGDPLV